ncbi:MAG: hypothetical protein ACK5JL_02775 [Candidatus Kapaibacterium sp.]
MAQIDLTSESFSVSYKRDGQERNATLDVLEMRLVFEDLERKHALERRDGQVYATRAFLSDVASELQKMGVDGATVSEAFQIWTKLGSVIEAIKKNTNGESGSE